jgi:hypothetical protein
MEKPQWKSGEEVTRWCKDFRSWVIALLQLMMTQIHEAHTDALLPERIIIGRALSKLHESASNDPYLIDNDFRYSIRMKLQAIQKEIHAHEIATGQRHTRERKIIENADGDFLTCSMISEG